MRNWYIRMPTRLTYVLVGGMGQILRYVALVISLIIVVKFEIQIRTRYAVSVYFRVFMAIWLSLRTLLGTVALEVLATARWLQYVPPGWWQMQINTTLRLKFKLPARAVHPRPGGVLAIPNAMPLACMGPPCWRWRLPPGHASGRGLSTCGVPRLH